MKLKNILLVVKDIQKAKQYYRDVFGLEVILDQGQTIILTEGLVLQEEAYWKEFLQKEVVSKHHSCELYFEEVQINEFVQKLTELYSETEFVTPLMELEWGQKLVRFYDLDGNLMEVRTPM
ncbi:MAG: VOC family protein [Lachnospiraceae bacterium]|nr:VOC family protein [Lachnospiraceae bacterium]